MSMTLDVLCHWFRRLTTMSILLTGSSCYCQVINVTVPGQPGVCVYYTVNGHHT